MNIETDDNDFQRVFGKRQWENPLKLNVLVTGAGYCGHETLLETCHHRSLTDDIKHQVALNAHELDVFSIAGLGGLCTPSQNRKNLKNFRTIRH